MTLAVPAVFIFATLDTKGREAAYVRDLLTSWQIPVVLVDVGAIGDPAVSADISRDRVFELAGTSLEAIKQRSDRGEAVTMAASGAARLAREAYDKGELAGVLALGGSAGTTIGTAAMKALPLGVPKVMVSTLASGMVRQFVGDKDIFMLNSVVDISGLNRISRLVLSQAARAMSGLVTRPGPQAAAGDKPDRPLVAATMFGVTTPCVERARETLEQAGCEVLVFHATGNGGRAMESLIDEGLIAGVLDITTTELADELVGGFLSAGPDRLTAASRAGIPQVVSTGAVDMVNFYAPDSVPARFKDRTFYKHNANVTLDAHDCGRECGHRRRDRTQTVSAATWSGRSAATRPWRIGDRSGGTAFRRCRRRGGRCTTRFLPTWTTLKYASSIFTSTIQNLQTRQQRSCSS